MDQIDNQAKLRRVMQLIYAVNSQFTAHLTISHTFSSLQVRDSLHGHVFSNR